MVSTDRECFNRKTHSMIEEVSGRGIQNGTSFRLMFPVYRDPVYSYSWQAF
jgi:hypothetical protein